MMIEELNDGMHVDGQFLVSNVARCVNNVGGTYLNIELKDASGSIQAKKWDSNAKDEEAFIVGNVVQIRGEVNKYKESLQLKIVSYELVPLNDVDTSRFMKAPPIPKETLVKNFNDVVASIKNEDCSKILKYLINKYKNKLFDHPAGVSVHHEYSSGLLVHVLTMVKMAEAMIEIYPNINRDILITGILIHDMGKLFEFEGPVVYKYTVEGRLLGHISIMMGELSKAIEILGIKGETPMLLEHMVLSHHALPEYGSPVVPMTKEAFILSQIDNLDSKMVVLEKALENTAKGNFTQKIYPLDGRSFYKPN